MPHRLTATDVAVQRLHQHPRKETVALAQIDEQPLVALLGLVL